MLSPRGHSRSVKRRKSSTNVMIPLHLWSNNNRSQLQDGGPPETYDTAAVRKHDAKIVMSQNLPIAFGSKKWRRGLHGRGGSRRKPFGLVTRFEWWMLQQRAREIARARGYAVIRPKSEVLFLISCTSRYYREERSWAVPLARCCGTSSSYCGTYRT